MNTARLRTPTWQADTHVLVLAFEENRGSYIVSWRWPLCRWNFTCNSQCKMRHEWFFSLISIAILMNRILELWKENSWWHRVCALTCQIDPRPTYLDPGCAALKETRFPPRIHWQTWSHVSFSFSPSAIYTHDLFVSPNRPCFLLLCILQLLLSGQSARRLLILALVFRCFWQKNTSIDWCLRTLSLKVCQWKA